MNGMYYAKEAVTIKYCLIMINDIDIYFMVCFYMRCQRQEQL